MSVSDNNGVSLTNGSVMRAGAFDQPLPNANSPAPSSTHGYRTLIHERNHDTLNDRMVPHRSTCSKRASTRGTEPVHLRNGKRSRAWTPAQTVLERRLSSYVQPSGLGSVPRKVNQPQTPETSTSIGMTHRNSGHHRTRRFKVSLVFDHVGDTDSRKPSMRSSNVHRDWNEAGKTAQPLIAITTGITGPGRLIVHFQNARKPDSGACHGYPPLLSEFCKRSFRCIIEWDQRFRRLTVNRTEHVR